MDRLFAIFGKITLSLFLLAIILGAGYFIGQNKIIQPQQTPTLSPTPQTSFVEKVEAQPSNIPTATSPTQTKKTLSGGLIEGTSFSLYTVDIPPDWTEKKEETPGVIDKLTLSKGEYALSIYQAAMGGSGCSYKGDPEQMMSQPFSTFAEFTGNGEIYRRSWNESQQTTQSYTICQKGTDSYMSPTRFGAISYTTPKNADETMLKEMDTIVASLKKQ